MLRRAVLLAGTECELLPLTTLFVPLPMLDASATLAGPCLQARILTEVAWRNAVDLRVPKRYLNAKDGCLRRDFRAVDCAMALCVAAAHRACRDALQTDSDLLA